MKLLKKDTRVATSDQLGHGLDAVLTLLVFFFAGFGLDRWLGTTPVFMIVMSILAGVGLFARFQYRYDERMTELEQEHAERVAGGRSGSNAADPRIAAPHRVAAAHRAQTRRSGRTGKGATA